MSYYDEFIKTLANFSKEIKAESLNSWKGIKRSQTEPDIIKQYLLDKNVGVHYLNEHLAKVISEKTGRYQIKFASVFTHQKPRVERTATSKLSCTGSTNEVELGDLLLIFCFVDKDKTVMLSRAHLIQAKKTSVLTSESQKCLYDSDLDFLMPQNIVDKSINPNRLRTLPSYKDDRIGFLSYLIINSSPKPPSLRQIPWSSDMEYGYESFLLRFILGEIGAQFTVPALTANNWDCIIDDLINVGTGKVPSETTRGTGLKFILDIFNYYYYYDEYKLETENPGLPTLYVIVQDKELHGEQL
jgi:hypothetical protein